MLLVRERAPLRLAASIATPSGRITRWAPDEHRAETAPSDLTFSSTMPGGFEQCSLNLPRKPDLNYQDLDEFSTLTVSGAGGQGAWQGRLERTPRVSGDHLAVSPGLVGWQAHLADDNTASEIYIDRDLSRWLSWSVSRQATILGLALNIAEFSWQVTADTVNGLPSLVITGQGTLNGKPIVEIWYDAGASNNVGRVRINTGAAIGYTFPDANNSLMFSSAFDAAATGVTSDTNVAGATPSRDWTLASARRYVMLQHEYAAVGPSGAAGTTYGYSLRNISVIGNHGLTLQGTAPNDGFLSSDIITNALGRWAPKLAYTTGTSGTVRPGTFVIPHLIFADRTTASDIIKQAGRFELYDWAVWEGPTFYYAPHGTFGRNWQARVGPSGLQENGPQVDRIWNGVIVQYADVTGLTRSVGPTGSGADTIDASLADADPLNAANAAGVRRWTKLQMNTSTSAAAIKVGQAFLAEQKLLNTSGEATLVGHVKDDHGVLWPAWKVRAGDTITFIDAHDTTPRRIIRAEYSDNTKTCQISLDSPPEGLQALLERLSVSVVPLGFT